MKGEMKIKSEELIYDLRLRDKLLAEGKVSKKDMDQYLESLPDDSENMERIGERKKQNSNTESEPA